jgi:hypothetical protein
VPRSFILVVPVGGGGKRPGVQKAYRRCALGMCSGIVVCRCFTPERAWLAMGHVVRNTAIAIGITFVTAVGVYLAIRLVVSAL